MRGTITIDDIKSTYPKYIGTLGTKVENEGNKNHLFDDVPGKVQDLISETKKWLTDKNFPYVKDMIRGRLDEIEPYCNEVLLSASTKRETYFSYKDSKYVDKFGDSAENFMNVWKKFLTKLSTYCSTQIGNYNDTEKTTISKELMTFSQDLKAAFNKLLDGGIIDPSVLETYSGSERGCAGIIETIKEFEKLKDLIFIIQRAVCVGAGFNI